MTHLQELVQALESTPDNGPNPEDGVIGRDLRLLLEAGLHPSDLPDDLKKGPAEAFAQTFEAMGGLPRLVMWADRNPGHFYKLFARLLIQTAAPITPHTADPAQKAADQWPEWLTARRLAYQEAGFGPTKGTPDAMETVEDTPNA